MPPPGGKPGGAASFSNRYLEAEFEEQRKRLDFKRQRQQLQLQQRRAGRSDCEQCLGEFCCPCCVVSASHLCCARGAPPTDADGGGRLAIDEDGGCCPDSLSFLVYSAFPAFAVLDLVAGAVAKRAELYPRCLGEVVCDWSVTACAVWIALTLSGLGVAAFALAGRAAAWAKRNCCGAGGGEGDGTAADPNHKETNSSAAAARDPSAPSRQQRTFPAAGPELSKDPRRSSGGNSGSNPNGCINSIEIVIS